ncbi:hypothetical protein D3C87_145760 [compost metagenome]
MAKSKRTARMLTRLEVEILRFVWKWKLANLMTLKYALAPQRSFWKFYRILRRLNQEGYIQEKINPEIQATLWTLTKKGFQVLDDGSMNFVTLGETLESWQEEIVRMWRFKKTNSIVEGMHTRMEELIRRAYGFRKFENFRLRARLYLG